MKRSIGAAASLVLSLCVLAGTAQGDVKPSEAKRLFEQRILPIFNSPHPSSCTECHLSGVDLKSYILPSHDLTFLSLRDQGLIDLARPRDSKILRFINMAGDKAAGSALISARVRKQEYEAFAAWIEASCRDRRLRNAARLPAEALGQPTRPPEVIRHSRSDRVLASFVANVWSQRFRCASCHAPGSKENDKIVRDEGEEVTWIRPEGPAATIEYLVANGNIDIDQPLRSRILRKATGEIKHGGGVKMRVGDAGYLALRGWLEDYARVRKGGYNQASELPSGPVWFASELWLRVKSAPPEWEGKLVRMTVHAFDPATGGFESDPIAVTSTIAEPNKKGRSFAHMTLSLRVPSAGLIEAARENQSPSLAEGKYQVRLFIGPADGVAADLDLVNRGRPVGQVEIVSPWKSGYPNATEFAADRLQ